MCTTNNICATCIYIKSSGAKIPGCQVARTIKSCTVAPNIFESSVYKLSFAPTTLKSLPDFWKNWSTLAMFPACITTRVQMYMKKLVRCVRNNISAQNWGKKIRQV